MSTAFKRRQNGFTLIEVMVSLSIFTIVVTICVSALYTLIEANARARNSQSIATNLSFTLDSLTREIRTGSDYYCADSSTELPYEADDASTNDCESGGEALSFTEGGQSLTHSTPNDSRRIAYRLNGGHLERRLGNGNGTLGADESADWLTLTSDDVVIEDLRFYVEGSDRGDDKAPMVTVFLSGTVGDEFTTASEFSIQTTISQRLLDF